MASTAMKTAGMYDARKLAVRRCREALVKADGNLTVAAKILKCTRDNVVNIIGRHPDLQELVSQLNETKLDTLEDKLFALGVEKDNVTAAIAWLNAHGKARGYSYGRAGSVAVSGVVEHRHLHMHKSGSALQDLSDSELRLRIEQRRAALALEGRNREVPALHPRTTIEGEATVVETGAGEPDAETG